MIDVSGRGYSGRTSYPGVSASVINSAGSHLGRGGQSGTDSSGATYGSVTRPRELGGGGHYSGSSNIRGGGRVEIRSNDLELNGSIRSDGASNANGSGAGGSVWISSDRITGSGQVTARGGNSGYRGGGGAIAIEYSDPDSELAPWVGKLNAQGSSYRSGDNQNSGAGTIWVKGPSATYGTLRIDNTGVVPGQATELPSLGSGLALSGSSGATLVTDRSASILSYFEGHWVEISGADGTVKGVAQISDIHEDRLTVTLEPEGAEALSVAAGDSWRGVYRFDSLSIEDSTLQSHDLLVTTNPAQITNGTWIKANAAAPLVDPSLMNLQSDASGATIVGLAGAVLDEDTPIKVVATNQRTLQQFSTTVTAENGGFMLGVVGAAGDTFTIRASDSHRWPMSSREVPVVGAIVETNSLASLLIEPASVAGGSSAVGTVVLAHQAQGDLAVSLSSGDSTIVSVPSQVIVGGGLTKAQFSISTDDPLSVTDVVITATLVTSRTAAVTVTPANAALQSIALSSTDIQSGTSITATATLSSPAPAGGAVVTLAASDDNRVSLPDTITIEEGTSSVDFIVTTRQTSADHTVTIDGHYGSTASSTLTLRACGEISAVEPPAATTLEAVWFDDAPSVGTVSGSGSWQSLLTASGAEALEIDATTGPAFWQVDGTSSLGVTSGDSLVLYALVDPCAPPREILVSWFDGSGTHRASWGEDRLDPSIGRAKIATIPLGGEWVRLEIPAPLVGLGTSSISGLRVEIDRGRAWFDLFGSEACAIGTIATPTTFPADDVWLDDGVPIGAIETGAGTWTTEQAASGSQSLKLPPATGMRSHSFMDIETIPVREGSLFIAYVLTNPCSPPREIMLSWSDSSGEHRAYWGEDLIDTGKTRARVGSLPTAGGWVRLEVPAALLGRLGSTITGVSVKVHGGGEIFFDRVGVVHPPNLALGKPARQSSLWSDGYPERAVNGNTVDRTATLSESSAWWEVDLGEVYAIETVDLWTFSSCCLSEFANFYLLISEEPFSSNTLGDLLNQKGVSGYRFEQQVSRPSAFSIHRAGRYVRIQRASGGQLKIGEVQVSGPVSKDRENYAGGRAAFQSSVTSGGLPARAVDGRTDGIWSIGTTQQTSSGADQWWQVDLGESRDIGRVDIFNRTDSQQQHIVGAYLLVSDAPFMSNVLADIIAQPGVSAWYVRDIRAGYDFDVGRSGRYVRVHMSESNYLHMAEVQVWSHDRSLEVNSKPGSPEEPR